MTSPPIHAQERKVHSDIQNHHDWLRNRKISNPETLGLYKKSDKHGNHNYAPGDYLGMMWLNEGEKRTVLRVDSKFPKMDYVAMYVECVTDPEIGNQIIKHLNFWPDQDLIETSEDDFSILSVISYLRQLNEMCQLLQPHLSRKEQNLICKRKGKTNHAKNIRYNIIQGRRDRTYSEYQSISHDTPANQILCTALERAARYVIKYHDETTRNMLEQWIHISRASLRHVSAIHVKPHHFDAAHKNDKSPLYRSSLTLAKAVLNQLGYNPQAELQQNQIPPFSLYSPKLFERYAEMKLRKDSSKKNSSNIVAPITMIDTDNPGAFNASVQPDFYDSDKTTPRIIDAKYKTLDVKSINREDKYQIIAYSQHRGLLNEMKCMHGSVQLGFAYPSVIDSKKIINNKVSRAFFHDIVIYEIPCPKKQRR